MKRQTEQTAPEIKDEKPVGRVQPDKGEAKARQNGVGKVLSGNVLSDSRLSRHYPFILYCCLLVLSYMGYIFACQRTQRAEVEQRITLQQKRAKALLYSSERIEATRHGNILGEIERRGINVKEWPTPPRIIKNETERP